ncbi:MAG: malto-oligosyltrehalose synthase, partial [Gillisia sp.]
MGGIFQEYGREIKFGDLMNSVDSTYRLQLSPQFTFKDLENIQEYLDELGIATIYSAPFFQAREGSTHGYDVLSPFGINAEIGDLKQFREIGHKLKDKQITWLQDIVPNHMAFDPENPWIRDIFELGPKSSYYNYFDIDWEYKGLKKVMLPFFGNTLEALLEKSELKLKFDKDGFSLNYYESKYPISARSYVEVLSGIQKGNFSAEFKGFSGNTSDWNDLKNSFYQEIEKDAQLKTELSAAIEKINHSSEEIQNLLDLQYFIPAHWKHTEQEINYRRFFTINGLICIRMEDPEVFEAYHAFIKELCEEGLINGLRIDHIDGLFDPEGYLKQLRQLLENDFFIIVEKILEANEKLPHHWPVEGTSGYEFLAKVNHLFTDANNEKAFTEAYKNISPENADYEALVYRKKLFILKERMGGELHNLCLLLNQNLLPESVNIYMEDTWKEALSVYLAAYPVYRIYPQAFPLKPNEKQILNQAYKKALEEFPEFKEELHYFNLLFMGEAGKDPVKTLYFLQRCQQFSGPLAAKGVEDTSFYIYNRLVAHNEVGDFPENFGLTVAEFHQNMMDRK